METSFKLLILATSFTGIIATSIAATPALNERQNQQKTRIAQGVASGELTVKEAKKLKQGQVQLQKMENRAKKDGVVSKKERARLQAKADKESAKIYQQKHDQQKY